MENVQNSIDQKAHSAISITLRLCFIAFLLIISFKILEPFALSIVWGIIIAVAIYPLFVWLTSVFNGREKLASTILVVLGIAIFIVPFAIIILNTVHGIEHFVGQLNDNTFKLPPPPHEIEKWPFIGEHLYELWLRSSRNLMFLIDKLKPFITEHLPAIFSSAAGVVGIIVHFILSVVISGFLLLYAREGKVIAEKIFKAIIGKGGAEFVALSQETIKGVVQGVLGTAVLQTAFLGIGLFVVGVPGAGIWTVLILIVTIVQLPPVIVVLPIIFYVFGAEDTMTAIVFAVWSVLWMTSDHVIKPILMGRGVESPMLVIMMGAIGGMVAFGIIGLFIGAVALAITYKVIVRMGSRQDLG